MDSSVSNKVLSLSGLLLIFISGVIIFIWKKTDTVDYLLQLFSVERIGKDLMLGLVGSLFLLLLLGVLVAAKKAYLPNTSGVNDLVNILHSSKSSLYIISILTVIGEELLFRGVLLLLIATFVPAWLSITLITVIFTAIHYKGQYEGQPYLLMYLFIMSLLSGVITIEQQTIWSACIIHGISNLTTSLLIQKNIIKIKPQ